VGVGIGEHLLTLALTHRSYAHEHGGLPTNERLEFLGDSVLGLVITEELYLAHPDDSEGRLAKLRASVVNMHALAEVARGLGPGGLGAHLRLGRGEERSGGADKPSILADGMESILGAVYLQHGLETSREVILRLFADLLARAEELGAGLDWKTSLQKLAVTAQAGAVHYEVVGSGPDHQREFTATAQVGGVDYGVGIGPTKKEAEQRSAEQAWRALTAEQAETRAAADMQDAGGADSGATDDPAETSAPAAAGRGPADEADEGA